MLTESLAGVDDAGEANLDVLVLAVGLENVLGGDAEGAETVKDCTKHNQTSAAIQVLTSLYMHCTHWAVGSLRWQRRRGRGGGD